MLLLDDIIDVYICGLATDCCVGKVDVGWGLVLYFSINLLLFKCMIINLLSWIYLFPENFQTCRLHIDIGMALHNFSYSITLSRSCKMVASGYLHYILYLHIIFVLFTASTAYHANELGFRTILIDDCSRGIRPETIQETFERVRADYGCVVNSSEVQF